MSKQILIGVDIGTSNIKAVATDTSLKILAEYSEVTPFTHEKNFSEIDAHKLAQTVISVASKAAQDAGASLITIIRTVMLPLALIPIIIALTFTSIGILGSFTVPFFLGANQPTMFGVEITNFFSVYNRPQQSIVMAFIVFAAASGIAFFYIWANFRNAKESGRV
jgi:ABC-type spermidine/putrescine transport system permease subunit I